MSDKRVQTVLTYAELNDLLGGEVGPIEAVVANPVRRQVQIIFAGAGPAVDQSVVRAQDFSAVDVYRGLTGIDRVGGGEFAVSWDARLIDDRGHVEGDWNYTRNCNGMIGAALLAKEGVHTPTTSKLSPDHIVAKAMGPAWFERLDGMSGKEGREYLLTIIARLEADPDRYRAMNPDNGWGNYDSLLKVLTEMCDAVPDWPTAWSVSG